MFRVTTAKYDCLQNRMCSFLRWGGGSEGGGHVCVSVCVGEGRGLSLVDNNSSRSLRLETKLHSLCFSLIF